MGFSDARISRAMGTSPERIRLIRKHHAILPVVKQIDTLAAEYPAQTNYLYLTYGGKTDDISFDTAGQIFVIGAGPIRIGSSVEFDWCTMNCVWELRRKGYSTTVLNCNPETVSTDYDMSDKLYFEELTLERVMDIIDKERPLGVIVSVGGQTSNNLAYPLSKRGVTLFGTFGSDIDSAEDRRKFSAILDRFKISQPPWKSFSSLHGAETFADKTGYPVIIRPSYVLSGSAMKVARNAVQLRRYIGVATKLSRDHPVLLSKFIEGAREVEVDGVSDGRRTFIGAVNEHIEDAGVHSGDATMVIPPISIPASTRKRILKYSHIIALELGVKGPFNIQYMVKGRNIYVIECNLRASRSMPFTSKTIGINLIKLAAGCMIGEPLPGGLKTADPAFYSIKMPMFSWSRFEGADPMLDVEMKSTGELACMGKTFAEAFLKAAVATESNLPLRLAGTNGAVVHGSGRVLTAGIDARTHKALEAEGFTVLTSSGDSSHPNLNPDLVVDFTADGIERKKWAPLGIPIIADRNFLRALLESLAESPALIARELKQYWRISGMHIELKINKIESGTVIDHLPPTKAYDILDALCIKEKYPNSVVTMATNVQSGKHGLKDILKIEGQLLNDKEIDQIRRIAGRFTISLISDYERVKKISQE
jgi:carbamoyl-phosphate synthase large subunit